MSGTYGPFDPLQSELDAEQYLYPGMGEPIPDPNPECERCEGSGWILANDMTNSQERECPDCHGLGVRDE